MMLRHHGVETFGRILDRNIAQARYLTRLVEAEPTLALMAPTASTIVCFRHDPGGMDEEALRAHNREIMLRLQESGVAVLTDTTLRGRHALRVAICNHRTRNEDLDLLLNEGAADRLGTRASMPTGRTWAITNAPAQRRSAPTTTLFYRGGCCRRGGCNFCR
jgi:glutamate/tyrosine decarboxylase-like PLP-dependent enzyme